MLVDRLEKRTRVFFDTNIWIYFFKEDDRYFPVIEPVFERVAEGRLGAITSYITLLELLVGPLKQGRVDVARDYKERLVATNGLELHVVDMGVAEKAAEIRAEINVKVPDALQLSAALNARAEAFVTNDRQLKRFADMDVLVLDDFC